MRISIIITLIFSSLALANDDKSMKELFHKYDQVVRQKKVELIDEVFTKKFIEGSGGEKELILKIKETPPAKEKNPSFEKPDWRKGLKGDMYFVKVKARSSKNKKVVHETEFIILKEEGKLKIDGNIGDAN